MMKKRILSMLLVVIMVMSLVPANVFAAENAPALPEANATVTGRDITVMTMDGEEVPVTFTMNFKAVEPSDEQYEYYKKWYADYVLTVNKDVTGMDGYLVGQYDQADADWIKIAVETEDVVIKANEPFKVMYNLGQMINEKSTYISYEDIINYVQDFDCGIYFTPEFLQANPDLEVTLELRIYNLHDMEENYRIGDAYTFTVEKQTAVASVNGEEYATLAEAWQNANGQTVTLLTDVTATSLFKVTNGQDITLDLNGCTITAENGREYILSVEEGGKLTINDATGNGGVINNNAYGYAIVNKGELVVNGGNFVGDYALYNGDYALTASATLNGGTFSANDGAFYSVANCSELVVNGATLNDWVNTSAKFTMESGKVENLYIGVADKAVASGVANVLNGGEIDAFYAEDENCPVTKDEDSTFAAPEGYCWNAENVLGEHNETTTVVAATCTEAGYTVHTCANCGVTYNTDEVAALGHTYEGEHFDGEPSYTKYTCSVCGDNYIDNDPATVTKQPESVTGIFVGDKVTFTVEAANAAGYQWLRRKPEGGWKVLTGETGTSLTVTAIEDNDFLYACKIFDYDGSYTVSDTVTYTAIWKFEIYEQSPATQEVVAGSKIRLFVSASGYGLTYKWMRRHEDGGWHVLSHDENAVYTFRAEKDNTVIYMCQVFNDKGEVLNSNEFTYTTLPFAEITNQTTEVADYKPGEEVKFFVETTKDNEEGARYQWYSSRYNNKGWKLLEGETNATMTLTAKPYDAEKGTGEKLYYICIIWDAHNNKTVSKAMEYSCVSELQLSEVVNPDGDKVYTKGEEVTFTFATTLDGQEGVRYQWLRRTPTGGWAVIKGATDTTLTIAAEAGNTRLFACKVFDQYGCWKLTETVTYTSMP